jgi:hypothetical protein
MRQLNHTGLEHTYPNGCANFFQGTTLARLFVDKPLAVKVGRVLDLEPTEFEAAFGFKAPSEAPDSLGYLRWGTAQRSMVHLLNVLDALGPDRGSCQGLGFALYVGLGLRDAPAHEINQVLAYWMGHGHPETGKWSVDSAISWIELCQISGGRPFLNLMAQQAVGGYTDSYALYAAGKLTDSATRADLDLYKKFATDWPNSYIADAALVALSPHAGEVGADFFRTIVRNGKIKDPGIAPDPHRALIILADLDDTVFLQALLDDAQYAPFHPTIRSALKHPGPVPASVAPHPAHQDLLKYAVADVRKARLLVRHYLNETKPDFFRTLLGPQFPFRGQGSLKWDVPLVAASALDQLTPEWRNEIRWQFAAERNVAEQALGTNRRTPDTERNG